MGRDGNYREEEGIDEWSGKSWAFGEEDDKNFRQQRLLPSRFASDPLADFTMHLFGLGAGTRHLLLASLVVECHPNQDVCHLILFAIDVFSYDKVTELEAEKRAWESSPEAKAIKEALNPWRNQDAEPKRNS
nr:hypothetical protein EUGRSUZ_H03704 [Ipomoea batatas]